MADPETRVLGLGKPGRREQPAHESLSSRATLVEVPLTGLSFLGVVGMRADPAAGGRWHGKFQGRRGLVASVLCSAVVDATPIVPLAGRILVPAHRPVPTMPQVLPWRSKPTRPAREKFCSRTRL